LSKSICKKCGLKKETISKTSGLCYECGWEEQNLEELRDINSTSMDGGIITTWNDSPSFLSKKDNYMYFRIPPTARLFFDPNKLYQIIVKEVA